MQSAKANAKHGKALYTHLTFPMPLVEVIGVVPERTVILAGDCLCAIKMARIAASHLAVAGFNTPLYRDYFQVEHINRVREIVQSIAYRRETIRIGPLVYKGTKPIVAKTLLGTPAYIAFHESRNRHRTPFNRAAIIVHELSHHYGAGDYKYAMGDKQVLIDYNLDHDESKPPSNNADSIAYFVTGLFESKQLYCDPRIMQTGWTVKRIPVQKSNDQ